MRKHISIIILISIVSVFAQAEFGMKLRMRSELQNLNSTNSDNQIYDRQVDLRFRPSIDYTVNDYLCVKSVFEIGDIQYGTDPGGTLGTDGIVLETKNAYMVLKPTENHMFKLGLIPYKDKHSVIIDTDLAGVLWEGKFDNYTVDLGWFAATDNDEKFIKNDTFSFGSSIYLLDMGYEVNKYITFGLNNIFELSRSEYMEGVNRDFISMYMAPWITYRYGIFSVDAQLVINNRSADYDNIGNNPDYVVTTEEEGNGIALSVKSKFTMDNKTTFRANLLFRGCYERWHNYQDLESFYDTGLEIINENANGITTHNPMNQFVISSRDSEGNPVYQYLGVVVPSVFVDWQYRKDIMFTGGLGFIINDQDYGKKLNYMNPEELAVNKDMFIGWEADIKAKIQLYDKMNIMPYFALFVPTYNYVYNTSNEPINQTEDGSPATDNQIKLGVSANYNF